jgi:hypothetical protein
MNSLARLREHVLGKPLVLDPEWGALLLPARVRIRTNHWVPRIGGWLAGTRAPAAAVTFGRTILVYPGIVLTRRLLLHELAHVRQWGADPFFPLRYALEWVRRGYWNNRYEQEARSAEFEQDTYSFDP